MRYLKEEQKRPKKKNKRTWLWLLVAAVLVIGAVVLLMNGEQELPGETTGPATGQTTPNQTDPEPPDGTEDQPAGIGVETPYMTFYYPAEWLGKVEAVKTDDGANSTVTFRTEIAGKTVDLFSIVMGHAASEGYLLGQLQDETAGTVNVFTVMYEADPADWTEAEYSEINALQERVNDIIIQFHEDERFSPS